MSETLELPWLIPGNNFFLLLVSNKGVLGVILIKKQGSLSCKRGQEREEKDGLSSIKDNKLIWTNWDKLKAGEE